MPYLLIELFYIGIPVLQTDGRSPAHSVYGHVITKFSRMGRLPHVLSYGAPAWSSANNNNNNIALKEIEKKRRYKDLGLEIQRMRQMKPEVIPVVVGALGTLKKGMVENIKKVLERATVTKTQNICMLGSARILRKVLSV